LLQELVPHAYGFDTVSEVFEAIHFKRVPDRSIVQLTPLLFAAASQGDLVAGAEVDRQAEEIVVMASTALRRLALQDSPVPIVLGGSVLAANHERLMTRVVSGLATRTPSAHIELVTAPPILGAGLLALEAAGAEPDAISRAELTLRTALTPVSENK
jgi:N-acetylglucosamine kinase-like BadF-type ATPase